MLTIFWVGVACMVFGLVGGFRFAAWLHDLPIMQEPPEKDGGWVDPL